MRYLVPLLALSACAEDFQPVDVSHDGGNAREAYETPSGERLESFDWGSESRNQVVDYVFVVDNSVSMNQVLERMRSSFAQLGPEDFPPESRIAVMNTVPNDPLSPKRAHPAVRVSQVAQNSPGFTGLVTKGKLERMRAKHPKLRSKFSEEGCSDDGWFAPGETNAAGISCLVAHTQSSLQAFGVEAGLTALEQMLQRNKGELTFRPGAAVNIVFVSDTHDPGVGRRAAGDLFTDRPTAEELIATIQRDNPVSSVRFHAIAPETECVEKWSSIGPSYYDAANDSGGAILDMCSAEDYRPVLQHALDVGARPVDPVLGLGARAEDVVSVSVDGKVTTWSLHPSGRAVVVDGVAKLPAGGSATVPTQKIEVHYRIDRPNRTMNP